MSIGLLYYLYLKLYTFEVVQKQLVLGESSDFAPVHRVPVAVPTRVAQEQLHVPVSVRPAYISFAVKYIVEKIVP